MGLYERNSFKHGSFTIAHSVANNPGFSLVGGGETIEVLKMSKNLDHIGWVSTGGGAMLSYLGGKKMPGLKKIIKN